MIYAFNLTCNRDLDLRNLMLDTYIKYTGNTAYSSVNTDIDYPGYGNGAGWQASMIKIKELRKIYEVYNPKDDDFVLSVDSDVVFTSPEVFKYANPAYGIVGTKHNELYKTALGMWSHLSGALIFIRGDIGRKIAEMTEAELNDIRFNHFKPYDLTENEDVILSYLASKFGAEQFDLGSVPGLSSGDFEGDVRKLIEVEYLQSKLTIAFPEQPRFYSSPMKSFYHLNYCPTQFLGEPVSGKWDIPKVLKMKGIEL